jgi:hypothetical protein
MDENTINGFLQNLASFILYAYLIIFVYIANELASERETKSREGMKMMGLQDGTYYTGWFVLYTFFCFYNSIIGTLIFSFTVLSNINPILIFSFLFLYGFSLFG